MLCQGLEILGVEDDNSWEKKSIFRMQQKENSYEQTKVFEIYVT